MCESILVVCVRESLFSCLCESVSAVCVIAFHTCVWEVILNNVPDGPSYVSMPAIHRQCSWVTSLLQAQFFNFHFRFWSWSHIDILLAVGASSPLKEKWTVKISSSRKNGLKHLHSFSLQPAQVPCLCLCLICQETIAVMKISNLKQHYDMEHNNSAETFPQNSEVITAKINALKSSYQAACRILVTSMTQQQKATECSLKNVVLFNHFNLSKWKWNFISVHTVLNEKDIFTHTHTHTPLLYSMPFQLTGIWAQAADN